MAGRKKRKKTREPLFDDLDPQTKQAIGAIALLVLGIYLALSLIGYAGMVGKYTNLGLDSLFGSGAYLAPIICFFYVYAFLKPRDDDRISISKIVGIAFLFLSLLGFLELYERDFGGWIGLAVKEPLYLLFGGLATGIILTSVFLIGVLLTFNLGLRWPTKEASDEESETDDMFAGLELEEETAAEAEDETEESEAEAKPDAPKQTLSNKLGLDKVSGFLVSSFEGQYDPPPLSLLSKDRGKSKSGDVKANANIIKRTLKNFNIEVEMDEVSIGPSVTRYALKPAEGVRISRIVGLQNNLELALAASPIRIEAPIPGRSLVGIEVPNTQKATVGLASLLSSPEYTDSPKPLLVALGRDITGTPHFANIAKMPHGLIAGTTGSGKSVTIHAIVSSLLFRNSPEQLRFIMIDPKRVELSLYNDIPHLLTPVINEPKKAILALKWAIKEMERRYTILQTEKVRDISSYHENIYKPAANSSKQKSEGDEEDTPESLPYIVIFIDELADLMSAYPRELEANIVRLAQMSRAVGIHLILSTQRPSVNVITGLIKANVPTRIALQVASQIDSRTIIDQVGAEKLLGQGDMLYVSSDMSKPVRLQSAFVSEEELKKVVKYLRDQSEAHELDSIDLDGNASDTGGEAFFGSVEESDEDDDLYEEAKETVVSAGKASTSFLQRKLRIGYSRAARLIDILEERGVIGPQDGSRPREILAGKEDDGETTERPE